MGLVLMAVLAIGVGTVLLMIATKKPGPLPPGPRGLPLIGNIFDFPPIGVHIWGHWLKHKDLYGPISSVTKWGTTVIILNSAELACELLGKRSSIYSTRMRSEFGGKMIGWENNLVLQPYNKRYRAHRKSIHSMIGTETTTMSYLSLQAAEAHRFLFRVLQEPDKLALHIRSETGALVLKTVYGYTVDHHKEDPLVKIVNTATEWFSDALIPGAWLVDMIPALRYVPEWLPGGGFKKTARYWRSLLVAAAEKPFWFTRQRMAEGKYGKSYVTDFGLDLSPEDEDIVKWTSFTLYTAGADTTANAITSFFLALTLYPEIQAKAREEIDRVVGSGRLPAYNDRDRLPYVTAVVTETLRWQPVLPVAFPHATTDDDVVNGYYIPKGSIVIPNVWWFTHDPAVYPNPLTFDPSRFLGDNPCPDPRDHVFGYGRRICPGRYFAYASLWLTIAQSLAVFDISEGSDKNGIGNIERPQAEKPTLLVSSGLISHLVPFKATIKPRSPQHEALIREVETLHPWEKSTEDRLDFEIYLCEFACRIILRKP
ncbi:cytochrome P450 oxidoreductase OrdA-like protein [Xylaria sp. CBS 124048]|nr:cytochrome P450 oxidoreductase OrdA-like protein [Xylaria sp. CBS 124048]